MTEPRWILIETSGQPGAVALAAGSQLLVERSLSTTQRHTRDLVPALQALLAEVGWHVSDVTAVAVSRGPGSFTGLRVGMMTAKTFAYVTGCAVVALDTFAVIAAGVEPLDALPLVVVADAQQQNVFTQTFTPGSAGWLPTEGIRIQSAAEWATTLPGARVVGPGLIKWAHLVPTTALMLPAEQWQPTCVAALRVAQRLWQAGDRAEVLALEPLYVRASAAEEKAPRG